jgi:hypothetical protein
MSDRTSQTVGRLRTIFAPAALTLLVALPARGTDVLTLAAAVPEAPAPATAAPDASFDPFAKGTWSLDSTLGGTFSLGTGPQDFVNGTFGAHYAVTDGLTLGAELAADGVLDGDPDEGVGGGFNLRARLRLARAGDVTFFADLSTGVLVTSVDVPHNGAHFNFRSAAGLGLYVPINDDAQLLTGVRATHVSHAGVAGGDNPGYNGVMFYVGVAWPL